MRSRLGVHATFLRCVLFSIRRFKGLLTVGNKFGVAFGIDESVFVAMLQAIVILFQIEIAGVRAEEDVAGERLEDCELMTKVVGDVRIGWIADDFVAFDDVWAADNNDVQCSASVDFVEG